METLIPRFAFILATSFTDVNPEFRVGASAPTHPGNLFPPEVCLSFYWLYVPLVGCDLSSLGYMCLELVCSYLTRRPSRRFHSESDVRL